MKKFYFLALLICLSALNLKAEIIYTDIIPDSIVKAADGQMYGYYYLDFNSDGEIDFDFRHFSPFFMNSVEVYCFAGGNIEGVLCDGQYTPLALELGIQISQNSGTWTNTYNGTANSALYISSDDMPGEIWDGAIDKFLGLRFQLNGNWHYGWARLDVPEDASSFTIKDYAYNDTPNEQILAGQGINGISDYKQDDYYNIVIKSNSVIIINNNQLEEYSYRLFDILGNVVNQGTIRGNTMINYLKKGAYIIIIQCCGKYYLRKALIP